MEVGAPIVTVSSSTVASSSSKSMSMPVPITIQIPQNFTPGSMLPGKCNSLPRKRTSDYYKNSNFQRNTPMRRSSGNETLVEYFVPRSVSEFNLTGLIEENGSFAPPQPISGVLRASGRLAGSGIKPSTSGGEGQCKGRDKMVTFEDDQVLQGSSTRKNMNMEDVFM